MPISKDSLIEKRNVLNEIRPNSMTLQELRFFSIYLAKINSQDISTRVVRFSLMDFQKIMELGKLNLIQLRGTVDSLLSKIVGIALETGGFARFQLFKKAVFTQDEISGWYIEIDAHDDALPLMFEFKEKYFTYELWNALRLKSANQIRMYEILKQYEHAGERTVTVKDLRELLGIGADEYKRFNNFRDRVLDACQEALEMYTDIKYTYEPAGRRGKGGKINAVRFTITKNKNHVDQISLADFISADSVSKN
jgi:plasmid replication initiation protein